ncbi:unnamed protein product [Prorocentrum cordatum]|uniref:Uncharacterized protein n=1 Tax=Prorocentrum cordatum TaxID=2364126 RepID=A0ABN9UIC3_9DINO|nr:unnamed protein product [Polarella glacialis]
MFFAAAAPAWGLKRVSESSSGSDGPARKVQVQELLAKGEDVYTVKKLRVVLAKLSLTNAAEIREITGMSWNTVLVDAKSHIAVEMMAQGKSNHEATKTAKGDPAAQGRLGPQYVHILAGFMLGLSMTQIEPEQGLTEFWTKGAAAEGKTPVDLLGEATHCKCKAANVKDGKPGQAKVTTAMGTEFVTVQAAITAAPAQSGGDLLEVLEGTSTGSKK